MFSGTAGILLGIASVDRYGRYIIWPIFIYLFILIKCCKTPRLTTASTQHFIRAVTFWRRGWDAIAIGFEKVVGKLIVQSAALVNWLRVL